MCAPAAIPLVFMGLGAVQQANAAKTASAANRQALEYQAAVERNKATMLRYQAKDALERGTQARFQHQLRTAQLKGAQRARLAAAGIDLNEGSALNTLLDTDFLSRQDELTIADNAEREAWVFRESAKTGMANADFIRRRAAMENPNQAKFTSLLGSAGQVASSWYSMYSTGAFSGGG